MSINVNTKKDDYGTTLAFWRSASIQISDLRMEKLQKMGKIAHFAKQCVKHGLAQLVVVVQVLVSQGQAENPLPDHRPGRVQATGLVAWIVQNPRHLLGQSQHPIQLPQQHRATVGSNRATGKKGSTSRPLQRGKRTNSGLQSVMGKVSFDIGLTN